MSDVRTAVASAFIALLAAAVWTSVGQSQGQRDRADQKRASSQEKQAATISADEKFVRDVYARLMRYQGAAVGVLKTREGGVSGPSEFLTFELQDVHTGPIEDILLKPLNELVTPTSGRIVRVKGTHLAVGDGIKHAYYAAGWEQTAVKEESAGRQETFQERFGKTQFKRYTSFEVTVHLLGEQRSYRALALHGEGANQIVDNIIGGITAVIKDESPLVRAPWNQYTKSVLYQAVIRTIKERKKAGEPLIPKEAPIGYLPGDDAVVMEADRFALAEPECQTTITIEFNPGEVRPDGSGTPNATTITVSTSPALANRTVNLTVASHEDAGHVNHTGNRPLGSLSSNQGQTNQNGAFTSTYTASAFGGSVDITATIGTVSGSKTLEVRVPDLGSIAVTNDWRLVGQLPQHPDNHYGTAWTNTNLSIIARDYNDQYYGVGQFPPWDERLRFNDMSLVKGGRFEIDGNWTDDDHDEHRLGRNCDLYSANVPQNRRAFLTQLFVNHDSPNFGDETASLNHWHLRFNR